MCKGCVRTTTGEQPQRRCGDPERTGLLLVLLAGKLHAGEAEDDEALVLVLGVQGLQAGVLRGEAALRRDVDDEHDLALELLEVERLVLDVLGLKLVERVGQASLERLLARRPRRRKQTTRRHSHTCCLHERGGRQRRKSGTRAGGWVRTWAGREQRRIGRFVLFVSFRLPLLLLPPLLSSLSFLSLSVLCVCPFPLSSRTAISSRCRSLHSSFASCSRVAALCLLLLLLLLLPPPPSLSLSHLPSITPLSSFS